MRFEGYARNLVHNKKASASISAPEPKSTSARPLGFGGAPGFKEPSV